MTSSITGTNLLVSGCTASGRKRSIDHVIHKRYLSTCPTSVIDPSLSTSTLSSLCTNAAALYSSTAGSTTASDTQLTDAVIRAVNGINSVYLSDTGYLSAANSQFTTGAKFGAMIAMASLIFSYIH